MNDWQLSQVKKLEKMTPELKKVNDVPGGGATYRLGQWDWWPFSRLRTAYNTYTGKKEYHVDADRLLKLAFPEGIPSATKLGLKPGKFGKQEPKAKKKYTRKQDRIRSWKARVYGEREFMYCYYCSTELPIKDMTVDHFIPLSKGGSDSPSNYVLSCEPCNRDKADAVPHEEERNR